MLNHVTYHVLPGTLDDPELDRFMEALGFMEVPANDPFEHGWKVRWWTIQTQALLGVRVSETTLHLVEGEWRGYDGEQNPYQADHLALGHFCVSKVGQRVFALLSQGKWCVHDSGSGRIWLQFANLRVEVRP